MDEDATLPRIVVTGIEGLDDILGGGLTADHIYLIDGNPGSGKTTLAMQFLLHGAKLGERGLYMTLAESRAELSASAISHGWSLDSIEVHEYLSSDDTLGLDRQLTMYHASEVELGETLGQMLADIEALRPQRVVIDALTELRLLSETSLRYRRQLLALKRFLAERGCTVLLLDDRSDRDADTHVESIAHGVISLAHHLTGYGADRRRLRVQKLRGRVFRAGLHDYAIRTGGLQVFPRLVAAEHHSSFKRTPLVSGISALDALLDGGPEAGTSTLLTGPAGSGKTTIAMQYAFAAAARGERTLVYVFDELRGLLIDRLESVGIDVKGALDSARLVIRQVDPTELSPGELVGQIRHEVEESEARVVVIDSLNGYLNAMPEERFLGAQLHELLAYLGQRGVATFMIVGQQGIVGPDMTAPIDASYLADTIVLFRYFENRGQVRKAISVTKKRGGSHENTIRELTIDRTGVRVGRALNEFQGVLTGMTTYVSDVAGETAMSSRAFAHGSTG